MQNLSMSEWFKNGYRKMITITAPMRWIRSVHGQRSSLSWNLLNYSWILSVMPMANQLWEAMAAEERHPLSYQGKLRVLHHMWRVWIRPYRVWRTAARYFNLNSSSGGNSHVRPTTCTQKCSTKSRNLASCEDLPVISRKCMKITMGEHSLQYH
jgi:hypothetical protein